MAKAARHRGWGEAALAALILLGFFLPWIYSMGVPVAAHEIREHLAGPHRLVSIFTGGSRVSRDYHLALGLYAVPLLAGMVPVLVLLGRFRPWVGVLAGAAGVAAFLFLRGELGSFPFHRLAVGSYLTLAAGVGLILSPLLRGSGKTWPVNSPSGPFTRTE